MSQASRPSRTKKVAPSGAQSPSSDVRAAMVPSFVVWIHAEIVIGVLAFFYGVQTILAFGRYYAGQM